MSVATRISIERATRLATDRLVDAGATQLNAEPVAAAMVRAEAEGIPVCGLYYLPVFCQQLRDGVIDGKAVPAVEKTAAGALVCDARDGFAHSAFRAGKTKLVSAAKETGIAALSVKRSGNALTLGHFAQDLAGAGLFGMALSTAPASVALPGGTAPLFGTNPLAFAVPGEKGARLLIDQSVGAVTKTEIIMRAEEGRPILPGWAQDASGKPTTDSKAALEGALLPAGGQKGGNIALLVELLAACIPGALLSIETGPFSGDVTTPPGAGQFYMAIDPDKFGGVNTHAVLDRLEEHFSDPLRLPGTKRFEKLADAEENGVMFSAEKMALLEVK